MDFIDIDGLGKLMNTIALILILRFYCKSNNDVTQKKSNKNDQ